MRSLSQTEQDLIKRMIDELIVGDGILDLQKLRISSENIDLDYLAKTACRYYRIIREGKVRIDFADIPKYLHLVGQIDDDRSTARHCLSCGSTESVTSTAESSLIPLCQKCHDKLDSDIKMMASILNE